MVFLSWLVIVDNFDVFSTGIRPVEANPPLVVHSDAVLTEPIPGELFESVTGRNS